MSGGLYKPLSDAQLKQVYETALELLEDVGMGTPVPEFIQVVTEAGGHMDCLLYTSPSPRDRG